MTVSLQIHEQRRIDLFDPCLPMRRPSLWQAGFRLFDSKMLLPYNLFFLILYPKPLSRQHHER
jgi:hypothetical protein